MVDILTVNENYAILKKCIKINGSTSLVSIEQPLNYRILGLYESINDQLIKLNFTMYPAGIHPKKYVENYEDFQIVYGEHIYENPHFQILPNESFNSRVLIFVFKNSNLKCELSWKIALNDDSEVINLIVTGKLENANFINCQFQHLELVNQNIKYLLTNEKKIKAFMTEGIIQESKVLVHKHYKIILPSGKIKTEYIFLTPLDLIKNGISVLQGSKVRVNSQSDQTIYLEIDKRVEVLKTRPSVQLLELVNVMEGGDKKKGENLQILKHICEIKINNPTDKIYKIYLIFEEVEMKGLVCSEEICKDLEGRVYIISKPNIRGKINIIRVEYLEEN